MCKDKEQIYKDSIKALVLICIISMLAMFLVCSFSIVLMSTQSAHAIESIDILMSGTERPDEIKIGE